MSYDQAGRLSYAGHQVYEYLSSAWTLKKQYNHASLSYDEVGQLSKKQLQTSLLRLAYKYTPRGWLCSQTSINGNTYETYLTQSLGYEANGNLNNQSITSYTTAVDGATYSYDGANRLTGYTASGSLSGYTESGITYDRNGNLLSLSRTYAGTTTNQLTYGYAGTGNRLNQVEDGAGNTDPTKGFVNGGSSSAGELSYDGAGNLTQDLNRGIGPGGIAYNVLNLARQVSKSGQVVSYVYDAAGAKRQTTAPNGDQAIYEGAFEYNATGILARINLEEGQLLRDVGGVYTVQYYLKDQLGNVRLVVKEDGNVLQQSDYYAFGLPILKQGTLAVNKYLTTGKEQQPQTNWLDFGARMYDPTIGQWLTIDPLAEVSRRWSPYTYVYNNPLRFIDPDGMEGQENQKRSDFEYSDGYSTQSYANSTISRSSFEGVYQNVVGGSGNTGQGGGPAAQDGPGKGRKGQVSGGISPANMPGTGIRKNGQGELESYTVEGSTGVFQDPFLTIVDFFYGTNYSGSNRDPEQRYIGGSPMGFGMAAGAAKTVGLGAQYSVAFEMKLASSFLSRCI